MIKPLSCPTCHKTLPADLTPESPLFPFCSERCRQVDLFRWFDGRFQIVEPIDPGLAAAMDEDLGDES
ncbi:MAG: DNA gyrase inhibitor YacG [Planctomycetales bacterium]|nr:DNA gyrase inhibitor YacG [Planctomycetales bacterium]